LGHWIFFDFFFRFSLGNGFIRDGFFSCVCAVNFFLLLLSQHCAFLSILSLSLSLLSVLSLFSALCSLTQICAELIDAAALPDLLASKQCGLRVLLHLLAPHSRRHFAPRESAAIAPPQLHHAAERAEVVIRFVRAS
jgi:hypothetical protein